MEKFLLRESAETLVQFEEDLRNSAEFHKWFEKTHSNKEIDYHKEVNDFLKFGYNNVQEIDFTKIYVVDLADNSNRNYINEMYCYWSVAVLLTALETTYKD